MDFIEQVCHIGFSSRINFSHRVAKYERLLSHSRFLLTLRSKEGNYHSLILFRLSPSAQEDTEPGPRSAYNQLYVMESTCPHLGADMSHADIEEYEDESLVAVCPWHRRVVRVCTFEYVLMSQLAKQFSGTTLI